jgi:hypothetical protein
MLLPLSLVASSLPALGHRIAAQHTSPVVYVREIAVQVCVARALPVCVSL